MKTTIVLFFTFLFFGAYAQNSNFCGTPHDAEGEKFLTNYFEGKVQLKNTTDIIWVPMTIHLVSPSNGSIPGFREKEAGIALCQLNVDFEPTGIQFYISSFNYIANDNYYDHTFQQGFQMMEFNNVNGTINSYFVSSPAGNCGYFSPSGGAVALAFGCSGPFSHTWAHEIGHYLSLPHTFRGWEGEDYEQGDIAPNVVNGSLVERAADTLNCANQADRFCDTPADYLSFRWNCNNNNESSVTQSDPDSTEFRSDGTYFMSYSNDACMDKFSMLQQDAMVVNLQTTKPNQIDSDYVPIEIDYENIYQVYPIDQEIVNDDDVLLQWEDEGQDIIGYHLEMSKFEGFNFIFEDVFVIGTSYMINDLQNDDEFFWRITPVTKSGSCNEPIVNSFITSFVVSTQDLEKQENLTLSPNPNNGSFILSSDVELIGTIRIYNMHSQLIYSEKATNSKSQSLNIITPSGLYILQIDLNGKKINKKFIVQ